jgi:hypothetical protein
MKFSGVSTGDSNCRSKTGIFPEFRCQISIAKLKAESEFGIYLCYFNKLWVLMKTNKGEKKPKVLYFKTSALGKKMIERVQQRLTGSFLFLI